MINDLTDLETVIGQYDPAKILVGPLLNLSLNSSFRFFYVAGNGSKTYESIALGFIEIETEAQQQREGIIAKLQSHFGKVHILGSQLEMAQAAHALWPNEEVTRFLAAAALEAKLQPTPAFGPDESCDQASNLGGALPSDHGQAAAAELTSLGDALDRLLTQASGPARDQAEATEMPPAPAAGPLKLPDNDASSPLDDESAIAAQPRHAALIEDDIALAVLGLKSAAAAVADTGAIPVSDATTESAAANRPATANRSMGSVLARLCAVGGAAVVGGSIMVIASTRQITKEAIPVAITAGSQTTDNDLWQTTASVRAAIPSPQIANVADSGLQVPPPATITSSSSQPSEPTRSQTGAAVAAGPPSEPAPVIASPVPGPDQSPSREPAATPAQNEAAPVARPQALPSPIASSQAAGPPGDRPQTPPAQTIKSSGEAAADERAAPAAEARRGQSRGAPAPLPQSVPAQHPDAPAQAAADKPAATAPESGHAPISGAPVGQPVAQSQSPPSRMASVETRVPPRSELQPAAKTLGAAELTALLSRSDDFIKNGDFAAARILLQRAAEAGSADAALMLGKTFDPLFLAELGAIGIQPDLVQCRRWYQSAIELGSDAAAQRLANLAQK